MTASAAEDVILWIKVVTSTKTSSGSDMPLAHSKIVVQIWPRGELLSAVSKDMELGTTASASNLELQRHFWSLWLIRERMSEITQRLHGLTLLGTVGESVLPRPLSAPEQLDRTN